MAPSQDVELDRIVDAAAADGIVSAAIFTLPADGSSLRLAAAAGIDGVALQRLEEAVRDPAHPIARTLVDAVAVFDVRPVAPGGPALRSHLPIFGENGAPVGVLAVAHNQPLEDPSRSRLLDLAEAARPALA